MKNICNRPLLPERIKQFKTTRAMKLTCALLLSTTMSVFATGNAQTIRVNIQANNVSTAKVLSEIEKQTNYLFVYNENEVDVSRKTSVHAVNETTAEVLSALFAVCVYSDGKAQKRLSAAIFVRVRAHATSLRPISERIY